MGLSKFLFIFFCPFLIFASTEIEYSTAFAQNFQEREFDRCLEILEDWEKIEPSRYGEILGMKAALHLCSGNLEQSKIFLDKSMEYLEPLKLQDPFFKQMIDLCYKIIGAKEEESLTLSGLTRFCAEEKLNQPRGVKIRYWFSVGQILVGVLIAPFNPPFGGTLITSGVITLVDAAADAIDNKDNWEKSLQDRQRINPSFNKSFFFKPKKSYAFGLTAM